MKSLVYVALAGLLCGGCNTARVMTAKAENKPVAKAELMAASGSSVRGTVLFTQMSDYVEVRADVTGLTPGLHGFHVHDKGDCSDPTATSAGGHFNPDMSMHGAPDSDMRHVGDLGNLAADNSGHASMVWKDRQLSFNGAHSILGRAVIIHASADDLKSQPAGNSGARIACGSIVSQ